MSLIGVAAKTRDPLGHCTGTASFVDDIKLPSILYCAFLRSPYAHARISTVETSKAVRVPGVVRAVTSAELDRATHRLKVAIPLPGQKTLYYEYLASKKVRFVGQPVVAVLATSRAAAEDALEEIEVVYEPLPVVKDAQVALDRDASLVYEEWGENVLVKASFRGGDTASAFQAADHVFREKFYIHRYLAAPLETRACLASYDHVSQILTCWVSTQGAHVHKTLLSEAVGLPEHRVRVVAPDVGGAFGAKCNISSEDVVVAYLALTTGRPVKWVETRKEHMLASNHAREQLHSIQVAVKAQGEILGVRDRIVGDLGASAPYPHSGVGTLIVTASMLPGPYRIKNYDFDVIGVVTNKSPFGAYRGFGQPEATFVMERMLDLISRELKLDPIQIRLKNMFSSRDLPVRCVTGALWDSGDFPRTLTDALELADYERYRELQRALRQKGRYLGIGVACNTETTVPSLRFQTGRWTAHDAARVKMHPDGAVSIYVGVSSIGTGIQTALAQVAADELRIKPPDIVVHLGDTEACPYSSGNWGSRSGAVCGAAVRLAAAKVKAKVLKVAAHLLKSSPDVLTLDDGRVRLRNDAEQSLAFREIGHVAYDEIFRLPEGMEPGLDFTCYYDPPGLSIAADDQGRVNVTGACSNAAQVAIVEVDPATGRVDILRHVVCHDSGVIINPAIVEGQVIGGVVQSIGGTLYESLIYDDNGQLLTSSFMDYLLPTANETPEIRVSHLETPSPNIVGGFKGVGESGTISAPAALVNAIEDAVIPLAPELKITRSLITPGWLWHSINRASASSLDARKKV